MFNTERLVQLSKPRQNYGKLSQTSPRTQDQDSNYGIPNSLKRLDKNTNSLKRLKYREEFLQAIKLSQHYDLNQPSPRRKTKK